MKKTNYFKKYSILFSKRFSKPLTRPFTKQAPIIIFVVITVAFFISGCLHDDESVNVGILNGTWFGVEQDVNNSGADGINKISFVILDGKITQILREDQDLTVMADQNLVGSIVAKTKNVFTYDLSDPTTTLGGLYVDTTSLHYTFLDDKFRFGVMQKGAADDPLLVFVDNDIAGNWSGFSVNVRNGTMSVVNNVNSQVTVDLDALTFVGSDNAASVTGGRFDGSLSLSNIKGVYTGNWANPDDSTKFGDITTILSSDKTFLSARLCLSFDLPPGNGVPNSQMCTFASWNK